MYTEQSFSILPLGSLTTQTIDEHKKLYAGYVKHANLVLEKINAYKGDETKVYETGELYRHFAFEFNGMRNHECYFELLSGKSDLTQGGPLFSALTSQWGSIEAFTASFIALALTRGIGWAMLSYDSIQKTLILHWVDEQHLGQLQGTTPLIALDMWEHSYVADYQPSGKKQYVLDFIEHLNWSAVEANFARAQ